MAGLFSYFSCATDCCDKDKLGKYEDVTHVIGVLKTKLSPWSEEEPAVYPQFGTVEETSCVYATDMSSAPASDAKERQRSPSVMCFVQAAVDGRDALDPAAPVSRWVAAPKPRAAAPAIVAPEPSNKSLMCFVEAAMNGTTAVDPAAAQQKTEVVPPPVAVPAKDLSPPVDLSKKPSLMAYVTNAVGALPSVAESTETTKERISFINLGSAVSGLKPGLSLVIDKKTGFIVVREVPENTLLHNWNLQNPAHALLKGDRILSVNGHSEKVELLKQLRKTGEWRVLVSRD